MFREQSQGKPRRGGSGQGGVRGGNRRMQSRQGPAVQVYRPSDGRVPVPDPKVTRAEDSLGKGLGLQTLALDPPRFPARPGYATKGTAVTLWANYVEMVPSSHLILYRYDISVSPLAPPKKLVQIIKLMFEEPVFASIRADLVTDFGSTLISRQRLAQDVMTVDLQYRSEKEDDPLPVATTYQVRAQYTNTLRVSDLLNYLSSTNLGETYEQQPMIQALNIFLNHYSKSTGDLATIGAHKSFSLGRNSDRVSLGVGLTAIRGFFSSVRVATCRILVNVNVSHGVFYDADRLDLLIGRFQSQHGPAKLSTFLKKLKVTTSHLREKRNRAGEVIPKLKTIHGLATVDDGHALPHPPRIKHTGAGPRQVEFWQESQHSPSTTASQGGKKKKGKKPAPAAGPQPNGRYVSVYDYFQTTYGIQIQSPDLPVVNVGTREQPSYLPPQVCHVVSGQPYNRQLDSEQTSNMLKFAARKPWENATSIVQQGLQTVGLSQSTNPLVTRFGMTIPPNLITVQGRILNTPNIVYQGKKPVEIRSGSWNMLNVKFNIAGRKLTKWSYLLVSTPGIDDAFPNPPSLRSVIEKLCQALESTGMLANSPLSGKRIVVNGIDDPNLEETFKSAADQLDLLFLILPSANHPLYPHIKRLCDIKYGIHTIGSVGAKLAEIKGQDQYLKNLALKFNLKMGGVNQIVESLRGSIIAEDKTMVVGIDVTHPSPGSSSNAPSIAAMVASFDKNLGQWPATLQIQSRARKEEVDNLGDMLKRHLDLWRSIGKHTSLPENILVFRDGVSEGQFDKVIDEELPQLRTACQERYPPADQAKGLPHFTIIVVTKRHQTRFYPVDPQKADRFSNPHPGTTVDRGITERHRWTFYMQPHASIQGTARPARYDVLLDEIFRRRYTTIPPQFNNLADVVENLVHGLCYIFGRATKPVSVCTPARYADMACERARHYLSHLYVDSAAHSVVSGDSGRVLANHDDIVVHTKLRNTMFYI